MNGRFTEIEELASTRVWGLGLLAILAGLTVGGCLLGAGGAGDARLQIFSPGSDVTSLNGSYRVETDSIALTTSEYRGAAGFFSSLRRDQIAVDALKNWGDSMSLTISPGEPFVAQFDLEGVGETDWFEISPFGEAYVPTLHSGAVRIPGFNCVARHHGDLTLLISKPEVPQKPFISLMLVQTLVFADSSNDPQGCLNYWKEVSESYEPLAVLPRNPTLLEIWAPFIYRGAIDLRRVADLQKITLIYSAKATRLAP